MLPEYSVDGYGTYVDDDDDDEDYVEGNDEAVFDSLSVITTNVVMNVCIQWGYPSPCYTGPGDAYSMLSNSGEK